MFCFKCITLLLEKDEEDADQEIEKIFPLVSFAASRRGGLNSDDYWDVAKVLELSLIGKDWSLARKAADKLLVIGKAVWNFETTCRNLKLIRNRFDKKGLDLKIFDSILDDFDIKIKSFKGQS